MTAPRYDPERATSAGSRWALWSWFEVPDSDHPDLVYLRRLRVVQTPLFGVYVHWIYSPDRDRDPHDHPWWFVSWVIRGGYTERVHTWLRRQGVAWSEAVTRSRWSVHRMPTSSAHVITDVDPGTMTLVLVGRRCRKWGFWTANGWVPWPTYTGTWPTWWR